MRAQNKILLLCGVKRTEKKDYLVCGGQYLSTLTFLDLDIN